MELDDKFFEIKRRKNGRPSKLTKAVQDEFVDLLGRGRWIETACAEIGVAKNSYYNWIRRGEAEEARIVNGEAPDPKEKIYIDFLYATSAAMENIEMLLLDVIYEKALADKDTSEVKWLLTRRNRARYGDQQIVKSEISGPDGGAIEIGDARAELIAKLTKGK